MKEDILEQVADDWFLSQEGVFTKHNVKFRPSGHHKDYQKKADSSFSDIDVLAYNVMGKGHDRVSAVTCKSWQSGFNPEWWARNLTTNPDASISGRSAWKFFRELVQPKWTAAFVEAVRSQTGESKFTYYVVCAKLYGNTDRLVFESKKDFIDAFARCGADVRISIRTFKELYEEYFTRVADNPRTTLEATQVGRLLQLVKASGVVQDKQAQSRWSPHESRSRGDQPNKSLEPTP